MLPIIFFRRALNVIRVDYLHIFALLTFTMTSKFILTYVKYQNSPLSILNAMKPFLFTFVVIVRSVVFMQNKKMRIPWIIPNVLCYLMSIVVLLFIISNTEGLIEINRLSIWVLIMLILFLVSVLGSFRIMSWIKQGKI